MILLLRFLLYLYVAFFSSLSPISLGAIPSKMATFPTYITAVIAVIAVMSSWWGTVAAPAAVLPGGAIVVLWLVVWPLGVMWGDIHEGPVWLRLLGGVLGPWVSGGCALLLGLGG